MIRLIHISLALIFLAIAAPAIAKPTRWELRRETATDVYILDHGLSLDDCAKAALRLRRHVKGELVCAPERRRR